MSDNEIESIVQAIRHALRRHSRSWSDYSLGKMLFQDRDLTPRQYDYLIKNLLDWLGL